MHPKYTTKQIERFWSKVDVRGEDECWVWTASFRRDGYGQLTLFNRPKSAHRVAWEVTYGEITNSSHVLHHCDNKACVNPKHLFLGTNFDNILDRMEKGRSTYGEKSWNHKLTWARVFYIRKRYAQGNIRQIDLAEEMGVALMTINDILTGRTWRDR